MHYRRPKWMQSNISCCEWTLAEDSSYSCGLGLVECSLFPPLSSPISCAVSSPLTTPVLLQCDINNARIQSVNVRPAARDVHKIANVRRRNPQTNLNEILHSSGYQWRNHLRKFWWPLVEAFWRGGVAHFKLFTDIFALPCILYRLQIEILKARINTYS